MSEQSHDPSGGPDAKRDKSKSEELSKLILGSMKSFTGEETVNWLKNVSENVPKGSGLASGKKMHLSQMSCIEALFEHFQRYALQFNRQHPRNPELQVQILKSQMGTHGDVLYRVMSTSEWGLALVAEPGKIVAVIMRAEFIPDFYARRANFAPFMEMQEATELGQTVWYVEGDPVSEDLLPVIAKKLFARLIRVVRGEASELEPFFLQLKDLSAQERASSYVEQAMSVHSQTVVAVCLEFLKLLDEELETLSAVGVKAIQNGQLDLAPQILKMTDNLKKMREGIAHAIREWHAPKLEDGKQHAEHAGESGASAESQQSTGAQHPSGTV
ncbi:MAG TPA: hypothetical protein V6D17_00950 [Candidatus Obscuribacterales bacterium]